MNKLELGQTADDGYMDGFRDAFHSPCVRVYCREPLLPGALVTFEDTCFDSVMPYNGNGKYDAVVDPFINGGIDPFKRFWVMLRPGTVENLTHNFKLASEDEDDWKRQNNIAVEDDDGCTHMGC